MDKYRMDGHKLMFHVPRVHEWLDKGDVYPVYMEVSPSGACNHRCVFCALDFMEYRPRLLHEDVFLDRIVELGHLGLKSMMFGGEGEPLIHKGMVRFVKQARESGIDGALTTNGVLLSEELAGQLLPKLEWIKVSINAGSPETYAAVHRAPPQDFTQVVHNLTRAAELRRSNLWRCTLGMQMILLPENAAEAPRLAAIARDAGMDYLVVKPYSQHPMSLTTRYKDVHYQDTVRLAEQLAGFNSDSFNVIFRSQAMHKWDDGDHSCPRCLALPFWSYIDAGGSVWGCSVYLGDERFLYGNIYQSTFEEIWKGERRRRSLEWVENEMDASQCRVNCRMDEVGRYLWNLRHPPYHVNFI
jgi:radical SAM protein with 4Fe4S-binding SPASM domain